VEVIADVLRERIIEGDLAPGTQLGEVQLAAQLEVSRGPVREALQRLVQEGLLVARAHRGVFVIELGSQDVADVYRARRVVEQAAAAAVVAEARTDVVDALDGLVDRLARAAARSRWSRVVTLDREFHRTLVDGAASPRLSRMFATLLAETAMCMGALEPAYTVRAEIVEEHRSLVGALRAGRPAAVRDAIDRHLGEAVTQLTTGRAPATA